MRSKLYAERNGGERHDVRAEHANGGRYAGGKVVAEVAEHLSISSVSDICRDGEAAEAMVEVDLPSSPSVRARSTAMANGTQRALHRDDDK